MWPSPEESRARTHSTRPRALDLAWNGGGREAGPCRFMNWKKTEIASTRSVFQQPARDPAFESSLTCRGTDGGNSPVELRSLGSVQYVLVEDLERHLGLHVAFVKTGGHHDDQIEIGNDEHTLPTESPGGRPVHNMSVDERTAEPELVAIEEDEETIDLGCG